MRLAVFDCDGTLVDSQDTIVGTMAHAFSAHGQPAPSAAAVRRVVGLPLLEAIARLGPDLSAALHAAIRESYAQAFFEKRKAGLLEPLYPGAVEALDAIEAAGWLLGIATGKSRRGLDLTLAAHGILDRFLTKQTSDVAAGKPNPDMLLRAMAEAGAAPQDTVMIGDTTFDIQMARNAGTRAVGVAWGYHEPGELWAAGADAVVERYLELAPTLDKLMETDRCGESVGS